MYKIWKKCFEIQIQILKQVKILNKNIEIQKIKIHYGRFLVRKE